MRINEDLVTHNAWEDEINMLVRIIYLPHSLSAVKNEEEESLISYCQSLPAAKTLEASGPPFKRRADFTLPRGNILIVKAQRQLTLFDGNKPIRQFPIAIGKVSTPTPVGNYTINAKILNPGGMLGTRWMGLDFDAYGIHGTNAPWSIGKMVSNGCIRMYNTNAEELFVLVKVGTPVYIRD